MFRKFAFISLVIVATSCAKQDPNQPSFAPAPLVQEPPGAPEERQNEADTLDEEASEPAPEGDLRAAPSPSAASEDDADAEKSKPMPARRTPTTPSEITGCSSETCINNCRPFGAAKQAACATAFAAGCFEPTRDPLQCGDYGIVEEKPASKDAVREMPNPKLY